MIVNGYLQVGYVQQQERKKWSKKGYDIPSDPFWMDQWSLVREIFKLISS